MTQQHDAILAAYRVFGLDGDEDFAAVRAAFRRRIREVHPDTSGSDDPRLLIQLQRMLKAYEVLQRFAPRYQDLEITPEEARKGGLRTVLVGDRNAMIRVPAYAKTGEIIVPVGDPLWRVRILVRDPMVDGGDTEGPAEIEARERKRRELEEMQARAEAEDSAGLLTAFYDRFVKASPAARFARWVRHGSKVA